MPHPEEMPREVTSDAASATSQAARVWPSASGHAHASPTTLQDLLAGGTLLPTDRVLAFVRQMAEELDHLHVQEFVHGGLTPACVVVEGDRTSIQTEGADRPGARLAYEAPEHRGPAHALSAQSDQYALALIAYELLLGRSRVSMDEAAGVPTIDEVDLSPARLLRAESGPAVNAVLRAATSRDPEARYPSTVAFADALADALREPGAHALLPHVVGAAAEPSPEVRPPRAGRRVVDRKVYDPTFGARLVTIAGLALAVATLIGAAWYGYYGQAPRFLTDLAGRRASDDPAALRIVLPGGQDGTPAGGAAPADGSTLGYVRVSTSGGSPVVVLDGRAVGRGSMLLAVEPGVHLIEVRENGRSYDPGSRPIRVGSRDTTDARFVAR